MSWRGRRLWLTFLVAVPILVAAGACEGTGGDQPSGERPLIGSDPDGLILSVSWKDQLGQDSPIRLGDRVEWPGAVLLETSEPGVLMVAVTGNTCTPAVVVSARGPADQLELIVDLSEPNPALVCGDIAQIHVFQVELVEPTNVGEVVVSVNVQP